MTSASSVAKALNRYSKDHIHLVGKADRASLKVLVAEYVTALDREEEEACKTPPFIHYLVDDRDFYGHYSSRHDDDSKILLLLELKVEHEMNHVMVPECMNHIMIVIT